MLIYVPQMLNVCTTQKAGSMSVNVRMVSVEMVTTVIRPLMVCCPYFQFVSLYFLHRYLPVLLQMLCKFRPVSFYRGFDIFTMMCATVKKPLLLVLDKWNINVILFHHCSRVFELYPSLNLVSITTEMFTVITLFLIVPITVFE